MPVDGVLMETAGVAPGCFVERRLSLISDPRGSKNKEQRHEGQGQGQGQGQGPRQREREGEREGGRGREGRGSTLTLDLCQPSTFHGVASLQVVTARSAPLACQALTAHLGLLTDLETQTIVGTNDVRSADVSGISDAAAKLGALDDRGGNLLQVFLRHLRRRCRLSTARLAREWHLGIW